MQYFAHTRKACGPIALALVLSACGEETSLSDAQAALQNAGGSQVSIAEQNNEELQRTSFSPAQSTVVAEFSPPSPAAETVASVGTNLETRLGNNNPVIPAPASNARPDTSGPVAAVPARPGGDTLPVQPPVGDPADASPIESGGDPIVTLVANSANALSRHGTQLEWNTENVDQCQTSGAWQGEVASSGVRSLSHDEAGEHTYMISCRGARGTAMAMVTVTVESTSLAWEAPAKNVDGSALTDLAGYNLYYGTESGRYTDVRSVRDASKTELELPVEPGTYYLAMTAYDMSGNESEMSNEIIRIIN